ncbi:hypothetical protein HK097_010535 [Rhizophlyctis rosea]|uniref:Uncharacterized protein n=1 Tax=Rhizophlyctis rosea TaxID=64517 RepID=A0AAD5S8Y7_9FUNG|nr:hypothetical protein HK097_010535 [Rhizophlyctis rosea]
MPSLTISPPCLAPSQQHYHSQNTMGLEVGQQTALGSFGQVRRLEKIPLRNFPLRSEADRPEDTGGKVNPKRKAASPNRAPQSPSPVTQQSPPPLRPRPKFTISDSESEVSSSWGSYQNSPASSAQFPSPASQSKYAARPSSPLRPSPSPPPPVRRIASAVALPRDQPVLTMATAEDRKVVAEWIHVHASTAACGEGCHVTKDVKVEGPAGITETKVPVKNDASSDASGVSSAPAAEKTVTPARSDIAVAPALGHTRSASAAVPDANVPMSVRARRRASTSWVPTGTNALDLISTVAKAGKFAALIQGGKIEVGDQGKGKEVLKSAVKPADAKPAGAELSIASHISEPALQPLKHPPGKVSHTNIGAVPPPPLPHASLHPNTRIGHTVPHFAPYPNPREMKRTYSNGLIRQSSAQSLAPSQRMAPSADTNQQPPRPLQHQRSHSTHLPVTHQPQLQQNTRPGYQPQLPSLPSALQQQQQATSNNGHPSQQHPNQSQHEQIYRQQLLQQHQRAMLLHQQRQQQMLMQQQQQNGNLTAQQQQQQQQQQQLYLLQQQQQQQWQMQLQQQRQQQLQYQQQQLRMQQKQQLQHAQNQQQQSRQQYNQEVQRQHQTRALEQYGIAERARIVGGAAGQVVVEQPRQNVGNAPARIGGAVVAAGGLPTPLETPSEEEVKGQVMGRNGEVPSGADKVMVGGLLTPAAEEGEERDQQSELRSVLRNGGAGRRSSATAKQVIVPRVYKSALSERLSKSQSPKGDLANIPDTNKPSAAPAAETEKSRPRNTDPSPVESAVNVQVTTSESLASAPPPTTVAPLARNPSPSPMVLPSVVSTTNAPTTPTPSTLTSPSLPPSPLSPSMPSPADPTPPNLTPQSPAPASQPTRTQQKLLLQRMQVLSSDPYSILHPSKQLMLDDAKTKAEAGLACLRAWGADPVADSLRRCRGRLAEQGGGDAGKSASGLRRAELRTAMGKQAAPAVSQTLSRPAINTSAPRPSNPPAQKEATHPPFAPPAPAASGSVKARSASPVRNRPSPATNNAGKRRSIFGWNLFGTSE